MPSVHLDVHIRVVSLSEDATLFSIPNHLSKSMSSFHPLVSVIIPTYNQPEFLVEAVDSVLAQTYPHVEVIVVDDGSRDHTAQVVADRYGERVRYIYQENAGTAAARNTGIEAATGELIALLDHDDRWLPQKLERQVPYFANHPEAGLVFTGGRSFDGRDGRTLSEFETAATLDFHDLLEWCYIVCATTMFPKRVVEEVGGFDAKLRGSDDWDMWIRISARYKVIGCPEALTELRIHGANQGHLVEPLKPDSILGCINKPRALHPDCPRCREALASGLA